MTTRTNNTTASHLPLRPSQPLTTLPLRASLLLMLLTLILCSCEENCRFDALDGFWRVDTIEDKATATVTQGQARLFVSFDYELVKLSWLPADRTTGFLGYEYIASCKKDADRLTFGIFYKYRQETILAPAENLASFGIPQGESTTFTYTITQGQLTLDSPTTRLTLTKY